jgi:hypothetical protein
VAKPKRKREMLETVEPEDMTTEKQYGARASTAKVCATCGHAYIRPCTTPKMVAACPNAQFLASQSKGAKGGKTR